MRNYCQCRPSQSRVGALVVKRNFAWVGRYLRMSKDFEYLTKSSEAMIHEGLDALDAPPTSTEGSLRSGKPPAIRGKALAHSFLNSLYSSFHMNATCLT